ncbi:MAG: hypothetical protein QF546_11505, partial [Alphaproteobacteria bacterium]|nr:hypothetical protein [Alphaproteobacteria bacterium]
REAATKGLASARYMLGLALLQGRGVSKDPEAGLKAITAAAKVGFDKAQVRLGRMLERGNVAAKAPAKAAEWYRRAVKQRSASAQYYLGLMHRDGRGVKLDAVQAYSLLSQAADRGRGKIKESASKARDKLAPTLSAGELEQARTLILHATGKKPKKKKK